MTGLPSYKFLKFDLRPDLFAYDPKRARESALFFEQYLKLTGDYEGQPMRLMEYQREVLDSVYGWTWRSGPLAGSRRFRKVFIDGPKQLGKSPLLSGWGIYHLFFDRVVRPYIISTAATYRQAIVVFGLAKEMIALTPALRMRCKSLDKMIRVPGNLGSWQISSSLNKAASGYDPTFTLIDELHEFPRNAGPGLDKAERNASKRRDSLFVIATNTGDDLETPWGRWRDRAQKTLDGEREELDLLPAIFAAPDDADISSPATWRQANPAIGTIASEAQYAADYQRTIGDKGAEVAFRRLGLGQVVCNAQTWIDRSLWDACQIEEIDESIKQKSELYIGLDLGPKRDITGVAYVFVHRETNRVYVEVDQFIPREAANAYEMSHCVPYRLWASETDDQGQPKRKEITILDVAAIDAEPQIALADHIAQRIKPYDVRLCCFDRFKADHLVYALEKTHGIPCEPISFTTFGLGAATRDFDARLSTGSISFVRNECLSWQARNVEVIVDKTGFALPVKPGYGRVATGGFKKIDGIVAILYGMARATRITEQSVQQQIAGWSGSLRQKAA